MTWRETINDLEKRLLYGVRLSANECAKTFRKLGLVEEKQMKKSDLRYGYVVKRRNGILAMFMPSTLGDIFSTGKMWSSLHHYTADLLNDYGFEELDIVEVYGYQQTPAYAIKLSTEGRELLWKRNEANGLADRIEKIASGFDYNWLPITAKASEELKEIAQEVRSLQGRPNR